MNIECLTRRSLVAILIRVIEANSTHEKENIYKKPKQVFTTSMASFRLGAIL